MSAGSVSAQGQKRVQQLKLCKNDKNNTRKMAQQDNECISKLSAVVALAYFQQKTKICRFQSEI
jgi:hypothetical protein